MGTGRGVLPVTCHESVAWISDLQSIATKKPLAGLVGQQTFDVALYILQGSPVISAFAANQDLPRRMLKHIMLALSMQGKAVLFRERK